MSKVVGVHGIANTFATSAQLADSWLKALQGGINEAGGGSIAPSDVDVVAYGALFRLDGMGKERVPRGKRSSTDGGSFVLEDEWEHDLLEQWWIAAAELSNENRRNGGTDDLSEDPWIEPPGLEGRARTPKFVQAALLQLAKSRFFRPIAPTVLISELRQVRIFLHDLAYKHAILGRFGRKISQETCVVIGHSLGSVVAYEALCMHPEWNIKMFVTLGSPLGIPNVVFDALTPRPLNGRATRPNVQRWVNVADRGDLVALEKRLAPKFGDVEDILVHNGWKSHDVLRYLSAAETGKAVADGLKLN
jgi:hypothetical protein